MFRHFTLAIFRLRNESAETCSCSLCNKFYTYLYHHIAVLDKYIHSNLVCNHVRDYIRSRSGRLGSQFLRPF